MASIEQLARTMVDQFTRGDLEGIRAGLAPDFVYEETGTSRRLTGPDEFIAALRQWKAAMPDGSGSVERLVVDGSTVAEEVVWRGTQTGPLATPDGDIPPSGRPIEVWATLWQEWRDGRLVSERHHLDLLAMLGQIGAIPQPA